MGPGVSCRRGNHRQNLPKGSFRAPISPDSCLDINKATEEELMTLPRIGRPLAHNITLHRQKIRGFRRVEDLALVTGVGAELMLELRPEICVGISAPEQTESNGLKTIYDKVITDNEPNSNIQSDTEQNHKQVLDKEIIE